MRKMDINLFLGCFLVLTIYSADAQEQANVLDPSEKLKGVKISNNAGLLKQNSLLRDALGVPAQDSISSFRSVSTSSTSRSKSSISNVGQPIALEKSLSNLAKSLSSRNKQTAELVNTFIKQLQTGGDLLGVVASVRNLPDSEQYSIISQIEETINQLPANERDQLILKYSDILSVATSDSTGTQNNGEVTSGQGDFFGTDINVQTQQNQNQQENSNSQTNTAQTNPKRPKFKGGKGGKGTKFLDVTHKPKSIKPDRKPSPNNKGTTSVTSTNEQTASTASGFFSRQSNDLAFSNTDTQSNVDTPSIIFVGEANSGQEGGISNRVQKNSNLISLPSMLDFNTNYDTNELKADQMDLALRDKGVSTVTGAQAFSNIQGSTLADPGPVTKSVDSGNQGPDVQVEGVQYPTIDNAFSGQVGGSRRDAGVASGSVSNTGSVSVEQTNQLSVQYPNVDTAFSVGDSRRNAGVVSGSVSNTGSVSAEQTNQLSGRTKTAGNQASTEEMIARIRLKNRQADIAARNRMQEMTPRFDFEEMFRKLNADVIERHGLSKVRSWLRNAPQFERTGRTGIRGTNRLALPFTEFGRTVEVAAPSNSIVGDKSPSSATVGSETETIISHENRPTTNTIINTNDNFPIGNAKVRFMPVGETTGNMPRRIIQRPGLVDPRNIRVVGPVRRLVRPPIRPLRRISRPGHFPRNFRFVNGVRRMSCRIDPLTGRCIQFLRPRPLPFQNRIRYPILP